MHRKSQKTQEAPKLVYLAHDGCADCGSGWVRVWTNGARRRGSYGRKRARGAGDSADGERLGGDRSEQEVR